MLICKSEVTGKNTSVFYIHTTYKFFFCFLYKESFPVVTQFHMKINRFSINFNINLCKTQAETLDCSVKITKLSNVWSIQYTLSPSDERVTIMSHFLPPPQNLRGDLHGPLPQNQWWPDWPLWAQRGRSRQQHFQLEPPGVYQAGGGEEKASHINFYVAGYLMLRFSQWRKED